MRFFVGPRSLLSRHWSDRKACLTKESQSVFLWAIEMDHSKEELHELFTYDPATGEIRNKIDRGPRAKSGSVAGTINNLGYVIIGIGKKYYKAHRIAWVMAYGAISGHIDHANGDPSDNRITNLRQASRSQNMHNCKVRRDNSSGVKGVSLRARCGKWKVHVMCGGKTYRATHETKEEAEMDAIKARRELHAEFARNS